MQELNRQVTRIAQEEQGRSEDRPRAFFPLHSAIPAPWRFDSISGEEVGGVIDLKVKLGRLALANPILAASGTFGYVREMAGLVRLDRLGGVIPKTVTRRPRAGNATPRTAETASGLLNAIGLDNDGIDHFRTHHLPYLRTVGTAVIANIAGEDEGQFVEMAAQIGEESGVAAVELNISCPNVSHGLDLGIDPVAVERLVGRVRDACPLPIIAKLTPNVTDIVAIARAAHQGGADAVSLVNTFRGMAVDWRRKRPILANDIGGLSGPAIKPLALRMVWEVARALPSYPIIGIGGITDADDALEFLVAGASAVQVGTATFADPTAAETLLDEMTRKLDEAGVARIGDLIGTLRSNRS
jgi:dihydroorotate dehydrogenase (NAD+) catalytic subunit